LSRFAARRTWRRCAVIEVRSLRDACLASSTGKPPIPASSDERVARGRPVDDPVPEVTVEDGELVIATARGERDALAALYDRHSPAMLGLGLKLLKDRGEAEEILHDVFLEAWRRAGDYDPARGSVRTWLLLRMRSRCLDRIKSAARSRTAPVGEHLERVVGAAPAEAADRADAQRVHGALADLPEEQRRILQLGYFAGLSCSEMATHLDIPIGTVKSRLHAAMTKLRAAFSAGRAER
jgi:RNA polymerase sigma-70 factor (ECF subfamily)